MESKAARPGPLAFFGSGEFEGWSDDVDRFMLARRGRDGIAFVVPTASAPDGDDVFDSWAQRGILHYEDLGLEARAFDVRSRSDAHRRDLVEELERAALIFISGGKPDFLAETLRDTPVWDAMIRAWRAGAALAGCSAGMCFMGALAPSSVTIHPSKARWVQAANLVSDTILIPHWDTLDEHDPRIRPALLDGFLAGRRLVGIGERTAMVRDATGWAVLGKGPVVVARAPGCAKYAPGDEIPARAIDTIS